MDSHQSMSMSSMENGDTVAHVDNIHGATTIMNAGMSMSMNTVFTNSVSVGNFLFQGVCITTAHEYVCAFLVIVLVCVLQESVTVIRLSQRRILKKKQQAFMCMHLSDDLKNNLKVGGKQDFYDRAKNDKSNFDFEHQQTPSEKEHHTIECRQSWLWLFLHEMLIVCLYAINISVSYILMLVVMTFNVGMFLAVVVGLSLGHYMIHVCNINVHYAQCKCTLSNSSLCFPATVAPSPIQRLFLNSRSQLLPKTTHHMELSDKEASDFETENLIYNHHSLDRNETTSASKGIMNTVYNSENRDCCINNVADDSEQDNDMEDDLDIYEEATQACCT